MNYSYYVVMCDFGKNGLEAVVHPEDTRRAVVEQLASGEYKNVVFVHLVEDGLVEDVTFELLEAAEQELKDEVRALKAARAAA